ncbi:Brp/Blh family beta-carotene 15,15'-dioxygenase [Halobacterium salinarum]|uniref:Brp/Blh family beta-carotene 15,15'-dioxygenase n=1 Tax=Halobacterium salinarum TaxID=2242 RepID=UPI001F469D30|nr:Brp/Blh family beta-carotene 15,15'-dioxygenase [Halobacterium salinarum]MCF2206327.1 Brp/Blh family beta-carotene 15,15'-dioxygenase [Halobacterium salinarum]
MSNRSQFVPSWLVPEAAGDLPLTVSRLSLLALAAAFAVGYGAGFAVPLEVQAGVYLLGMVAMNLPHGGYEHFENLRRRAASFQGKYIVAYLVGIAAFGALFFVAPVAGLGLAVTVAVAKGGFGGVQSMDALYGTDHLRTRPQRWLAAVVRGGAVMVVPMVFWTPTFYAFSSVMISIFDPSAVSALGGDIATRRLVLGGGYGALVVAHLGLGYRRAAGTGSFLADAAETLLLIAYFALVPVVIAVGLYFPLWYSARQVARSSAVDDTAVTQADATGVLDALDADDPARATLASWAVLIVGSVATFGLAAVLWLLSPQPLGGGGILVGLVAFWSIFVSIIALPHVVVGGWLDRTRGIWYVP